MQGWGGGSIGHPGQTLNPTGLPWRGRKTQPGDFRGLRGGDTWIQGIGPSAISVHTQVCGAPPWPCMITTKPQSESGSRVTLRVTHSHSQSHAEPQSESLRAPVRVTQSPSQSHSEPQSESLSAPVRVTQSPSQSHSEPQSESLRAPVTESKSKSDSELEVMVPFNGALDPKPLVSFRGLGHPQAPCAHLPPAAHSPSALLLCT